MDGTHWQDDRVVRRNLAGVVVGAITGFVAAVLLGWIFDAPGDRWPLMVGLAGAAGGALLGRLLARTVTPDEIEPRASNRPFVGAATPDDDSATAESPPSPRPV